MKRYVNLSEDLKEIARELHPHDYTEWSYQVQGVEIAFSAKNNEKSRVEINEDSIHIYDNEGEEIVMWVDNEWADDPNVVISITKAVCIFYKEGPEALKAKLKRNWS